MVDCVMIDPACDGWVFDLALAGIPERKEDLVRGHYEPPAAAGAITVAATMVDMLGEDVLSTASC